jgi:segregation and condensation protein B
MNTRAALEAILFVTETPLPVEELAEVLEVSRDEIQIELDALGAELSRRDSGMVLRQAGGGWRLYSHPEAYP